MARDYGEAHGGQPWPGAKPPYGRPRYGQPGYGPPGGQLPNSQPPNSQPPHGRQPPPGAPPPYDRARYDPQYAGRPFPGPAQGPPQDPGALRRRRRSVAWALVVIGGLVFAVSAFGAADQGGPRKFTAKEAQQITNWEYGKRWRDLPAGTIFPESASYQAPEALDDDPSLALAAHRAGIAKEASCKAAADPSAAAVLDSGGCSAMLRATYLDETDSFVVTVGAAALPTPASAQQAAQAIKGATRSGRGATVRAVPFAGTSAGQFGDGQRQLSGVLARGTYVILYTVGYADSRRQQDVSRDSYTDAEMTSAGSGVAADVLSALAAPVPAPRCPGAGVPGC